MEISAKLFGFLSFVGMLFFFLISLIVLLILNSKKFTLNFFKLIAILPIINRFKKKLIGISREFSLGFDRLKKSKVLAQILLLTFSLWILEGVIFLLSARAVGINLSYPFFALPLFSILLGILTLIPGGLGSIEAILILLLTLVGFPAPQATSAVLIYRFIVHLLENSIGAFVIPRVYGFNIIKKIIKGKIS